MAIVIAHGPTAKQGEVLNAKRKRLVKMDRGQRRQELKKEIKNLKDAADHIAELYELIEVIYDRLGHRLMKIK